MFVPLLLSAQNKFGYYSHKDVLAAMPGYQQSVEEFELLKQRCNAEIEHNEQELTRKYVAFLDGQQEFPEPILRKRQKELQVMVDNSVQFRDRLKVWLAQAKDSLCAPHNQAVGVALAKVCRRMDLAYIVNSDEAQYKYVNPKFADDITALVIEEVLNPTPDEVQPAAECAETGEEQEEEIPVPDGNAATGTVGIATDTVATDSISVATDTIQ